MTVGRLCEELPEAELGEWMQYARIRPLGETGAWMRVAMLCSLLANINRDPKKSSEFKPDDFMPGKKSRTVPDSKTLRADFEAAFGVRRTRKSD